jgi:hypothetical protein
MVKTCSMQLRDEVVKRRENVKSAYTINRVGKQNQGETRYSAFNANSKSDHLKLVSDLAIVLSKD